MVKNQSRIWLVAVVVGWLFDFLFWGKQPGISFPIFTTLCLAAGLFLAWVEGIRPAWQSLSLLVPLLFFAWMVAVRMEPVTVLLNAGFTIGLLAVFTTSFREGRWPMYSLWDYITRLVHLGITALGLPAVTSLQARKENPDASHSTTWKKLVPVLRGLLLALPVLAVFASLLSSADPIFKRGLADLLQFFDIDRLAEYILRLAIILVMAYLLAGVFLYAITHQRGEPAGGASQPDSMAFLGFTEGAIILGSVTLLFAAFVIVQVRYFFGGNVNITLEGFTYSEYARRGFGELVAVAFFSMLLILGLGAITQRPDPRQRRIFSATGICQVVLVSVILVSAFQRLVLYEQAYGFTRLRTYTHVFMAWLAVLLLGVMVLEFTARLRRFAFIALLSALGFGITLNLLNVDQFIVRQNVARAIAGRELDTAHLATLSLDSIPSIVDAYQNQALSSEVRADLGGAVSCQAAVSAQDKKEAPWQSYHFARAHARNLFQSLQSSLQDYPVTRAQDGAWKVEILGQSRQCFSVIMD